MKCEIYVRRSLRMQRRDFLKSTVAAAVAAELGMGKAQAKVPAHNWGNFDYRLRSPGDRSAQSGSVPSISTGCGYSHRRCGDDDDSLGRRRAELWQGTGHLCHSRQWHRGNQVRQYSASDRGFSSFSLRPAALHPPDVERSAAEARTPGFARLREAGFCIGEEKQQASRIAHSDVRP